MIYGINYAHERRLYLVSLITSFHWLDHNIMNKLKELQTQSGAVFAENLEVPLTFNNQNFSLSQWENNVFLCDRSDWGLLKVTGCDRLRFLHNQSTNDIQSLKSGQGCDTVFVNSTGRNIDLVSVYFKEEEVLLLTSPNQNQKLYQWMDRYIFPFDKVELKDISSDYKIFTIFGNNSQELLSNWVDKEILEKPEFYHQNLTIDGIEILLTVGCNLKIKGYNLIVNQDQADIIWQKLIEKKPKLIGSKEWEILRVLRGRPAPEKELTEDFNPLETGLWDSISFSKGCYIGQETIARLNTYKGVKQRLWGIKLNQEINPDIENTIFLGEEKIGRITSFINYENEPFALGYIRTKAGGEGLQVKIGKAEGRVISLPYVIHEYRN
ncbi:folate-binding protein [Cyanobacterium aponinum UTEX 3222]|uniref:CAF17-like 4Fe-4S cluster assembly/insertion protein YgfZ n=1 Tax=Cyanobacterium aponinum TaxID=379064 RepID=UPI0030937782|nr:folate-binding protein [Cyanobacterium aponinum UTEX 3222]